MLSNQSGNFVRLLLMRVSRFTQNQFRLSRGATLLNYVGQLVNEQFLAGGSARIIGSVTEEDVLSGGEGDGIDIATKGVSVEISMHADAARISAKGIPHFRARGVVQGLPLVPLLLDAGLAVRRYLGAFIGRSRQGDHTLDVAIPVPP